MKYCTVLVRPYNIYHYNHAGEPRHVARLSGVVFYSLAGGQLRNQRFAVVEETFNDPQTAMFWMKSWSFRLVRTISQRHCYLEECLSINSSLVLIVSVMDERIVWSTTVMSIVQNSKIMLLALRFLSDQ